MGDALNEDWLSGACIGEYCSICGKPATAKVEEAIDFEDPAALRHPLIAYVCREHFRKIMGPAADALEDYRRSLSDG